jgi:hypothetical protein
LYRACGPVPLGLNLRKLPPRPTLQFNAVRQ